MRLLAASALLALVASPAHAFQLDADARSRVDSVFSEYDRTTGPGCALGVVQNGRLVLSRGYGIGNLDHGIPLRGSSVFYLASVSKQFAAAAVLIAADEGLLSLDDDIRAHIPEFPDYGTTVTVRHLLHHTSGIRDYLSLMQLAVIPYENVLSDENMLGLITRQKELNFTPGAEHLYSNSGYVLLAEIVKRATGRSLRVYADEKIFGPLGMMDTHFHDDRHHVVPNRVFSYDKADNGGWATNYLMNFDKVGDGGLYSTVEDLARWDAAFYADLLGVEGFAAKMYQRGVLANGDTINYARGLAISPRRGLARVLHGGSLMGFRTGIVRYPDQRTTVITLCNVSSARSGALSAAVEDIVLGASFLEPVPPVSAPGGAQSVPVKPAQVSEGVIRQMAGSYRSEELRATWVLEPAAGKLVLKVPGDDVDFTPRGETVYTGSGVTLTFLREGDQVVAFVLQAGRVKNLRFDRVP